MKDKIYDIDILKSDQYKDFVIIFDVKKRETPLLVLEQITFDELIKDYKALKKAMDL